MKLLSKISEHMLNRKTPQTAKQVADYFLCSRGYAYTNLEALVKVHELVKLNTTPRTYLNRRFYRGN